MVLGLAQSKNKVLPFAPEEAVTPRSSGSEHHILSMNGVKPYRAAADDCLAFESPRAEAILTKLSAALAGANAEGMRAAGEHGMVVRGETTYYIHDTCDAQALAWAARHFATRASSSGTSLIQNDEFQALTGMRGESAPRLTAASAQRLEELLKDVIERGDGASLIQGASLVHEWCSDHCASQPRLRALTWAARVLGERCERGDFGKPSPPLIKSEPDALPPPVEMAQPIMAPNADGGMDGGLIDAQERVAAFELS